MEFFIVVPGIDLIPMKPSNIVNGIGISPSTLHVKIFYRDKVFGIRSPPLTRNKVNLIENKLVFNNLCIRWHDSLITKLFSKSVGFFQMKSRLRGV
ncbi:hypothetical protein NC651_033442 [Populus alba x Populus x berolinensis]|nr:hypothetical protein NC651_033442 [Populus alba x Populus x berolinensis]